MSAAGWRLTAACVRVCWRAGWLVCWLACLLTGGWWEWLPSNASGRSHAECEMPLPCMIVCGCQRLLYVIAWVFFFSSPLRSQQLAEPSRWHADHFTLFPNNFKSLYLQFINWISKFSIAWLNFNKIIINNKTKLSVYKNESVTKRSARKNARNCARLSSKFNVANRPNKW